MHVKSQTLTILLTLSKIDLPEIIVRLTKISIYTHDSPCSMQSNYGQTIPGKTETFSDFVLA